MKISVKWLMGLAIISMNTPIQATVYSCPEAHRIHLTQSRDTHGHLRCAYHADLDPGAIHLTHIINRPKGGLCPPAPSPLTSVILVRRGLRAGLLSCGYGQPNSKHRVWGLSNQSESQRAALKGCRLAGIADSSLKHHALRECAQTPKRCDILCNQS